MKKITVALVAGVAALGFASSGFAADLIIEDDFDEPDVVVADNWTGPYIGLHAGWGRGTRDVCFNWEFDPTIPDPPECDEPTDFDEEFEYDLEGWLIGAQAGFLFQLTDNVVVGLEGAISRTNITGEAVEATGSGTGTYEWLATGTGIIGVTFESVMLYAEGGIAGAHFNFVGADAALGCDYTADHFGAVAGIGAAVKVAEGFSVFAEYNRVWLDEQHATCTTDAGPINIETEEEGHLDIFKIGFNAHFN